MDEEDLVCNYKKCRKRLKDIAYVTACSHVFCDEHGATKLIKGVACPACKTSLAAKYDMVVNNLQPSDQQKSMMLAGLKPDVISDICFKAMSFWVYQSFQEKMYQEQMAVKALEKAGQLEVYYEQTLARINAELSTCKESLEEIRRKCNEVSDKLMEKTRQHQKLQSMYESMRRKYVTMSSIESRMPSTPTIHLPFNGGAGDARFEFNPSSGSVASLGAADLAMNRIRENYPTPRR